MRSFHFRISNLYSHKPRESVTICDNFLFRVTSIQLIHSQSPLAPTYSDARKYVCLCRRTALACFWPCKTTTIGIGRFQMDQIFIILSAYISYEISGVRDYRR